MPYLCSRVQMNMNGLCELFVAMAEEEIYLSLYRIPTCVLLANTASDLI